MRDRGRNGRIALLSAALLLGGGVTPVMAQDAATPEVGATPEAVVLEDTGMPMLSATAVGMVKPYFEATLEPGGSASFTLMVGNYGSTAQRVRVFPADVYSRVNGGFESRLAGEPIGGTTEWLDLKDEIFELKPGETTERKFSVSVPEGTKPGEYLTSVVMQTADPVKGTGAVAIDQILRQALAVAVDVPGDRSGAMEVGEAVYYDGPAVDTVQVAVKNTGNIRLAPSATVDVKDASGTSVTGTEMDMDSIYAGTDTIIELPLIKPLENGEYTVSVKLDDAERGVSAEAADLPMTVNIVAEEAAGPTIAGIDVTAAMDSAGKVQMTQVTVNVPNTGPQIDTANVILIVKKDGQLVEEYPLAQGVKIANGENPFATRYLPMAGFEPGMWEFSARLEGIDPNSGEKVELVTSESSTPLDVK